MTPDTLIETLPTPDAQIETLPTLPLAKINYRIHTDVIKRNIIPQEVSPQQANIIYAEFRKNELEMYEKCTIASKSLIYF